MKLTTDLGGTAVPGESAPTATDGSITTPSQQSPVALSARKVSKHFRSRSGQARAALSGINLDIHQGEFVALLGPSGCGKTTLLRLLAGLDTATEGEVELLGVPVDGPSESTSMVFQGSVLLPWKSILNNVLLPANIRGFPRKDWEDRARGLLADTGLAAFADHFPRELSGGMRQRAAICRALLLDPPVMLMDEPFGSLDAITRAKMNEDLLAIWLATTKTIVFVTHDIAEAVRVSRKVVVMSPSPGRISHVVDLGFGRQNYGERLASPSFAEHTQHLESLIHDVTSA